WWSRSATTAAASTPPARPGSAWPASQTASTSPAVVCGYEVSPAPALGSAPSCRCQPAPTAGGQAVAEPMRIVLADDNYLVREGTRRLLEGSGEVIVTAAVGSAPELVDAVATTRAEAVIS